MSYWHRQTMRRIDLDDVEPTPAPRCTRCDSELPDKIPDIGVWEYTVTLCPKCNRDDHIAKGISEKEFWMPVDPRLEYTPEELEYIERTGGTWRTRLGAPPK